MPGVTLNYIHLLESDRLLSTQNDELKYGTPSCTIDSTSIPRRTVAIRRSETFEQLASNCYQVFQEYHRHYRHHFEQYDDVYGRYKLGWYYTTMRRNGLVTSICVLTTREEKNSVQCP